MNAADRKIASEAFSKLEKLASEFEEIKSELSDLADAEQEKYDNMSEGLQAGEKGQTIQTAAENLREAAEADGPQEAVDALGNIEL